MTIIFIAHIETGADISQVTLIFPNTTEDKAQKDGLKACEQLGLKVADYYTSIKR